MKTMVRRILVRTAVSEWNETRTWFVVWFVCVCVVLMMQGKNAKDSTMDRLIAFEEKCKFEVSSNEDSLCC